MNTQVCMAIAREGYGRKRDIKVGAKTCLCSSETTIVQINYSTMILETFSARPPCKFCMPSSS